MEQILEQLSEKHSQAILLIFCVVLGFIFAKRSIKGLRVLANKTDTDADDKIIKFLDKFYIFILLAILIIGLLRVYEVDITPLMAGAGVASLIIGLAIKEILADMFAGVSLITDRPFAEGDRIQVTKISGHWGSWGDVQKIGLRRTKVENTDGVVVNYPNSMLAQSAIINFSDKNDDKQPVRGRIRFSVSWDADLDQAMEVARLALVKGVETAREQGLLACEIHDALPVGDNQKSPLTLNTNPKVIVRSIWDDTRGLATAGILLEGRYYLEDVRDRTKVRSILLKQIFDDLQEHDIPFPAPMLAIKNVDAAGAEEAS